MYENGCLWLDLPSPNKIDGKFMTVSIDERRGRGETPLSPPPGRLLVYQKGEHLASKQ